MMGVFIAPAIVDLFVIIMTAIMSVGEMKKLSNPQKQIVVSI